MEDNKSEKQSTTSPKVMSSCQSSVASSISYQDAEFEVTRFIDCGADYHEQRASDKSNSDGGSCFDTPTTPIAKIITESGQKIV